MVHSLLMIATPIALISSYSTSFELKHALKLSKATRLFVDSKLLPLALSVAKEVGLSHKRIYLLQGSGHGRVKKCFGDMIHEVRSKKISRVEVRPAKNDTLAYLVFSSGTSGLPKGP